MLLERKKKEIDKIFLDCRSLEDKYEKIIKLGREMPDFDKSFCTNERLVQGCQSIMYLHSEYKNGKMRFEAYSEALISAGLAALLILYYNDETPQTILMNPPYFLNELGIVASLTPGRSNGLASLYKKIKQEALMRYLEEKEASSKSP